jgi:hypothetical protein
MKPPRCTLTPSRASQKMLKVHLGNHLGEPLLIGTKSQEELSKKILIGVVAHIRKPPG